MTTLTKDNIWDVYAPAYAKITPLMHQELLTYLASRLQGKVLDIGTGTGKLFQYIGNADKLDSITAVDNNKAMLAFARKNARLIGCPTQVQCSDTPYDGEKYNTIVACNVLYAVENPIIFLTEMKSKLLHGATLLLSTPSDCTDFDRVEKQVDREFSANHPLHADYLLCKTCNEFLLSDGFTPRLFSSNVLLSIIMAIGFEVVEVNTQHFYGGNITLTLRNP